jgi:hypothetical protein
MPSYLTFEVELLEAKPRLWRRFMVTAASTFLDLHEAIQDACGWENCHLFAFRASARGPGIAASPVEDMEMPDASKIALSKFFKSRGPTACTYEYDFGDSWMHRVTLVERTEQPERFERRLLAGARAFPPEDCGGTYGYGDCVALLAREARGEKLTGDERERLEWIGDWRPDAFDLNEARRRFDG